MLSNNFRKKKNKMVRGDFRKQSPLTVHEHIIITYRTVYQSLGW